MVNIKFNRIWAGTIFILALIITFINIFFNNQNKSQFEVLSSMDTSPISEVGEKQSKIIYVQVQGAVQEPGLYEMKSGDRVNDLLTVAKATNYNQECVNLAKKLVDEENIYIPKNDEACQQQMPVDDNGIVDINEANELELQTLPGIGEAKAKAIIEYRETNGTFEQKQDLLQVKGISENLLASIEESISLS